VELAVLGWTQQEIATEVHVSQAAVSKLLARADERALRELSARIERHKVRQTQRLERVFAESMRAWEQSKADTTRRRQRQSTGRGGTGASDMTVAEVVMQTHHGDPRYLDTARKAMADLRRIWGLDAPQQVAVSPADPYAALTEAELLDRIAQQDMWLRQAAAVGRTPPTGGTDE